MYLLSPTEPLGFLMLDLRVRLDRIRSEETDAGASAIEWVIITFVLAALAIAVGLIITNLVTTKASSIKTQ